MITTIFTFIAFCYAMIVYNSMITQFCIVGIWFLIGMIVDITIGIIYDRIERRKKT